MLWTNVGMSVYMQILGAIHTGAPVIILTCIVKDLLMVSVFSIYNMIVIGLYGIMSIFSSGLSASFGDVIIRKQEDILKTSYQQFEVVYLSLITAVYSVAMVMIMPFIAIYTSGITDANYICSFHWLSDYSECIPFQLKISSGDVTCCCGII